MTIRCAHCYIYIVTWLNLEVDRLFVCVEVAVSTTLPVPVLLGTDVAQLPKLSC